MEIKFTAKRVLRYEFSVFGESRAAILKDVARMKAEENNMDGRELFDTMNTGRVVSDSIEKVQRVHNPA